jgi:Zn-finger nucleic acid-binding protein
MKCPRDGTELTIDVSGFACGDCKGLWLSKRWIEDIKHQRGNFSTTAFFGKFRQAIQTAKLPCPTGCGPLVVCTIYAVELDWCETCGGVWFDSQEMEQARSFWRPSDNSSGLGPVDVLTGLLAVLSP